MLLLMLPRQRWGLSEASINGRGEGSHRHEREGNSGERSNLPATKTIQPHTGCSPTPCQGPPSSSPMAVSLRCMHSEFSPLAGKLPLLGPAEILGTMCSVHLAPSGYTRCQWERQVLESFPESSFSLRYWRGHHSSIFEVGAKMPPGALD